MRLIDADALTKEIEMDIEDVGLQERMIFYRINDAPTVDAVEVVRCKDCMRYMMKQADAQSVNAEKGESHE